MDEILPLGPKPDEDTHNAPATPDLETLVTEIGASYPLMLFAADAEEAEESMNEQILAGLVRS